MPSGHHAGRSRQIRIASHDAVEWKSNSEFTVDLGNSIIDVNTGVFGVSIESCGFKNAVQNVRATEFEPNGPEVLIRVYNGAVLETQQVYYLPPGWWTAESVQVFLTQALAGNRAPQPVWPTPNVPIVSLVNLNQDETTYDKRLRFTVTGGGNRWVNLVGSRDGDANAMTLANYLGWPIDPSIAGLQQLNVPDPVQWSTAFSVAPHLANFQGDSALFLHSSVLLHDQSSLDGEGLVNSVLIPIPITAPYLGIQTYTPEQYQRPTIVYNESVSIRTVNLTLRDVKGRAVDIGTGELWVVLRFWW